MAEAKSIRAFEGEHRWLSNFWEVPIELSAFHQRWIFASTEHVFQMAKLEHTRLDISDQQELFEEVAALETPGQSKRFGRRIPELDVDSWNAARDRAMARTLMAKFTQHADLREKLLGLEGYYLEESNHWGDRYWGVDGTGKNRLGELLMELRDRWLGKRAETPDWQPPYFVPDYRFEKIGGRP